MPEFRLRDPDGGEHVTGDASERARLLGQGYTDADDDDSNSSGSNSGDSELAAPDTTASKRTTPKPTTQNLTDAGK